EAARARAGSESRRRVVVLVRLTRGEGGRSRVTGQAVITLADLDYELPPELIAQEPCVPRDAARLLVLERKTGALSELRFSELAEAAQPSDLFVVNDTRVIPAKLRGTKASGGKAEGLLVSPRPHRDSPPFAKARA